MSNAYRPRARGHHATDADRPAERLGRLAERAYDALSRQLLAGNRLGDAPDDDPISGPLPDGHTREIPLPWLRDVEPKGMRLDGRDRWVPASVTPIEGTT